MIKISNRSLPVQNKSANNLKPTIRISALVKKNKKRDFSRKNQLKFLLMLGFVNTYMKEYQFRVNYNDFSYSQISIDTWQLVYNKFQELKIQLSSQVKRLEILKGVQSKPFQENSSFIVRNKQNKMYHSEYIPKKTMLDGRNKNERSLYKLRYEQEIVIFEKLNVFIDKADSKNLIKKSIQHLNILKAIVKNLRIAIYKYYKQLKLMDSESNKKIQNIKYYCSIVFTTVKEIFIIITSIIEKDQNYNKLVFYFQHYQPKIEANDTIDKYLQATLFHFTSVEELQRLYQLCPRLIEVAEGNIEIVDQLINNIIRLRHILGYLGKEIINLNLNSKQKKIPTLKGVSHDIWKTIYNKKYVRVSTKFSLNFQ